MTTIKKYLTGYNSSLPVGGGSTGATIPSSPSPAIAIQIEVSSLIEVISIFCTISIITNISHCYDMLIEVVTTMVMIIDTIITIFAVRWTLTLLRRQQMVCLESSSSDWVWQTLT